MKNLKLIFSDLTSLKEHINSQINNKIKVKTQDKTYTGINKGIEKHVVNGLVREYLFVNNHGVLLENIKTMTLIINK